MLATVDCSDGAGDGEVQQILLNFLSNKIFTPMSRIESIEYVSQTSRIAKITLTVFDHVIDPMLLIMDTAVR